MPPTTSIPRFLLPQRSSIWRPQLLLTNASPSIRLASKKTPPKKPQPPQNARQNPSKPLVLEKPTKFNPPSHGSRLAKPAPRYPGPALSPEEKAAQATNKYPNMMPPPGTFLHWFMHNKTIHIWITLGTLSVLAFTVLITNFKRDSPFADMLPHWTQLFIHPIAFSRTVMEVMKLHSQHVTAQTQERRKHKVEDVSKRAAYRKAHGLDKDEGFGGWTAKTDKELLGPAIPVGDAGETKAEDKLESKGEGEETPGLYVADKKFSGKRWLGIW